MKTGTLDKNSPISPMEGRSRVGKPELRKKFLTQRKNFKTTQVDEVTVKEQAIRSRLKQYLSGISFDSIMFYYPHAGEVSLLPLLEDFWSNHSDKIVLFSKVLGGGEMVALPVSKKEDLVVGYMGIKEPVFSQGLESVKSVEKKYSPDVILVPGVAFNILHKEARSELGRLGYGRGYYDRFLKQYLKAEKIGIFFEFQKTDIDFTESHDVGLDSIVTESFIYYASDI